MVDVKALLLPSIAHFLEETLDTRSVLCKAVKAIQEGFNTPFAHSISLIKKGPLRLQRE
jgi:hypothetical protein